MAIGTTTAAIIGAVGVAISAVGAVQQGMAQSRQAKFQSAVMRQQAERERLDAAAREDDFRRQQSRLLATRRAMLGASGVEPSEGSPLLVSEDFAGETEYQALRIRAGGELQATRLEQSAQLSALAGRNARTGGLFRGGSLLLQGAGSLYRPRGALLRDESDVAVSF
jgi:hypothetical protein